MDREVYRVLDAIRHGRDLDDHAERRWISALKTVLWVRETEAGFVLTSEGDRARLDLAEARAPPPTRAEGREAGV